MRISDWSSDVCSSDLSRIGRRRTRRWWSGLLAEVPDLDRGSGRRWLGDRILRRMAANTLVLLGGKAVGGLLSLATMALAVRALGLEGRSEERRGGKEGVRTCRSRWSPDP